MAMGKLTLVAPRQFGKRTNRKPRTVRKNYSSTLRRSNKLAPMVSTNTKYVRLRYGISLSTRSATSIGTDIFSANNIKLPWLSGSGTSVRGFAEWMAFYDQFYVTFSRIKLRVCHITPAVGSSSQICGIVLKNSTALISTQADLLEARRSKNILLPPEKTGYLSAYCHVGKTLGIRDVVGDSQLKGTFLSNPSEQMYFHTFTWDLNGTNPGPWIEYSGYIDYHVVFTDPKPLAAPV